MPNEIQKVLGLWYQFVILVSAMLWLSLDGDGSLQRQLYRALRAAILSGHLAGGTRLPSTRTLAREVGVSRNTVLQACERLIAEGYVATASHRTRTCRWSSGRGYSGAARAIFRRGDSRIRHPAARRSSARHSRAISAARAASRVRPSRS